MAFPHGVRLLAENLLSEEGVRKAEIGSTELNPFNGLLVVDNFRITTPEGRGINAGRVVIDLSRSELFDRRIYLHDVVLRDATLDLIRDEDGVYVAGFPPSGETAQEDEAESDDSWLFGLEELILRDTAITMHDGDASETAQIARAHLTGIAMWDTERTGRIAFGVKLPFGSLEINGQLKPLGETKFFRGSVTIDSLDVARSVRLADPSRKAPAEGAVTTSLQVDAEITAGQTIEMAANGALSTDRLTLADGVRLDDTALREIDARFTLGSNGSSGRLAAALEVGRITLPLDGGAFQTAALRWKGRIEETAKANGEVSFSLSGALAQGATEFSGPDGLKVSYGGFDANDLRISGETDEKGNTTARIDGPVALSGIVVRTPEMTFTEPRLNWQGSIRVAAPAGAGPGYDFAGELKTGEATIELPAQGMTGGFRELLWSGRARVAAGQDAPVTHDGSLTVDGIGVTVRNPVKSLFDARTLSFEKVVSGSDGNWSAERVAVDGLTVDAAGPVHTVAKAELLEFENMTAAASGNWSVARAGLRSLGIDSDGPVASAANVDLVELEALSGDRVRNWRAGRLAVNGIRVDSRDPAMNVLTAGSVTAQEVSAAADGSWTSRSAAIRNVVVLAALSAAQTVDGEAAETAEPADAPLKLDAIIANGIGHNGQSRLDIDNVLVNGFSAEMVREQNEEIHLIGSEIALVNALAKSSASSPPLEAQGSSTTDAAASSRPVSGSEAGNAGPLTFRVGEWRIGENSRLVFIDRSVQPDVDLTLEGLTGRLQNLDSAEPNSPVPIDLQAQAGEFGKLKASGTIKPFTDRLSLDMNGTLTGFELPQISGYARSMLGYAVTRGRLDARFDVTVRNGKLDGDNKLTISKLKVERANGGAQKGGASIPLETAISLLRNSKDVIELQLPVNGDITNPKFDFSDAINQAIAGAVRKAVTTTLSLTFPLGGVIKAISRAGQPDRLGLQPVPFEPGNAEINPAAREFIGQLARMLRARPDVKLTICGVATPRDRQAMQEEKRRDAEQAAAEAAREKAAATREWRAGQQPYPTQPLPQVEPEPVKPPSVSQDALLELSGERGTAVKSVLVESQSIPENRLFLCEPQIDSEGNASPRADILL